MNTQHIPPRIAQSVTFSLSRWDIVFCRLWVLVHNRKLMAILLLMCLGVPLISYHRPEGIRSPILYSILYFTFGLGVMVGFMAVVQVVFHMFWVLVNKNRGVVGEHTLEINDEGLLEKTPFNESLHRWTGFHKIQASRKYLFVFVTDNIVHYVPFRAFASPEEASGFRAELERRANAA